MICLTMWNYNDSSISQWENQNETLKWNIGAIIPLENFPYIVLIQL
jgi:hypothetical protein